MENYWSNHHRFHRRQPSPFLNPVALILAIPILILILLFFILPPFISHATQIIRPSSVKKSWDYFNIVLVLFAILCGIFARRNDDVPSSNENAEPETVTTVSTFVNEPRHSVVSWLEFPDRKMYESVEAENGVRLRRNSSSYPDLRQESSWENGGGIGNEFRFYDDFEVNKYRSRENSNSNISRKISQQVVSEETETVIREIPVDKFEVTSPPLPPAQPKPSPPPPPPPPAATRPRKRRSYHKIPREEKKQVEIQDTQKVEEKEAIETQPSEPPPPENKSPTMSPSPAEEETEFQFPDVISETVYKKKTGTMKKELATAIASLYKGQKRKRKKKVSKNRDIYENAPHNSPPQQTQQLPTQQPPPPPPPPPINITPTKKLQNLFKKGIKQKRVHTDPPTAPPPPPPPMKNVFNNMFKTKRLPTSFDPPSPPPLPPNSILNSIINTTGNISRRFKNATSSTSTTPVPPPPPMPESRRKRDLFPKPPRPSYRYNESAMYAPRSPLLPMPPPPPPPPFKMSKKDYGAKETDDFDVMSVKSDGEEVIGPSVVTCPSPDVNAKADNFIARLRDEWRLEKMNSIKKRELA